MARRVYTRSAVLMSCQPRHPRARSRPARPHVPSLWAAWWPVTWPSSRTCRCDHRVRWPWSSEQQPPCMGGQSWPVCVSCPCLRIYTARTDVWPNHSGPVFARQFNEVIDQEAPLSLAPCARNTPPWRRAQEAPDEATGARSGRRDAQRAVHPAEHNKQRELLHVQLPVRGPPADCTMIVICMYNKTANFGSCQSLCATDAHRANSCGSETMPMSKSRRV